MRVFITDCEGPISKNDNAFELSSHFIPDGAHFFTLLSKYDDILADVVREPGYKAGDTLRLILPFLKAYGVTNEKIKRYSSGNILLISGARDTLRFVNENMPSFIVSTSYEQYMSALCGVTGFPYNNVYCTKLDLGKYNVSKEEREKLKELRREIACMPVMDIPDGARSVADFSRIDRENIMRLDDILVWEILPKMASGRMLEEVSPVGGEEKASSIQDILKKLHANLSDTMYVGDSMTDVQAFQLVREGDGLTVSFNGNSYAIREAEVAVISDSTLITTYLAYNFNQFGKEGVIKIAKKCRDGRICDGQHYPRLELITERNRERLIKESSEFRKTVRGEAIGRLG